MSKRTPHDHKAKPQRGATGKPSNLSKSSKFRHVQIAQIAREHALLMRPILKERKDIAEARDIFKRASSKYDAPDSKSGDPMAKREAANEAQAQMVRRSLQSSLGNRPVEFVLPVSFDVKCASTGVLSGVTPFNVALSVEWTALAALFDEFKVLHTSTKFNLFSAGPQVEPTQSASADYLAVVGFDPLEGTPLSSTRQGCELAQHYLFGTVNTDPRTGSFMTRAVFTRADGMPHHFISGSPEGIQIANNSGAMIEGAGFWYSTLSTTDTLYFGQLKWFAFTAQTAVTSVVAGILYHKVLFRCRT